MTWGWLDFRKEHRRLLALAIKSEGHRFYKGDVGSQVVQVHGESSMNLAGGKGE